MIQTPARVIFKAIGRAAFVNLVGYSLIYASALILPPFWRNVLYGGDIFKDPIWFQMGMWFPFFLGLASLWGMRSEQSAMLQHLTKEPLIGGEPDEIMGARELGEVLRKVKSDSDKPSAIAKQIIKQVIWKYQTAKSSDQASGMLDSMIELFAHRLDLQYSFVRYLSWLIPSLGFMGTVFGISVAVSVVGVSRPDDPTLLPNIAKNLAVAFDTTFLALIQASILLFVMNRMESRDERFVNYLSQYVQEKLINRLE